MIMNEHNKRVIDALTSAVLDSNGGLGHVLRVLESITDLTPAASHVLHALRLVETRCDAAARFRVTFIVNGESVGIDVYRDQPLADVVAVVLRESANLGRPWRDWELRTHDGVRLPIEGNVESVHGQPMPLYLSLAIGWGA